MAGSGPPPKERRRRQNADIYADVQATVSPDGEVRGPKLAGTWLPETVEWHETWRRAPQAATFVDTDWMRLRMLAALVEDYFGNPHHLKLAEIRLNESLLGATHVDRLKARMKIEQPAPVEVPVGVTAINEYRNRLTG
jgi:hypothetical protein